jgi:hypothetical protein
MPPKPQFLSDFVGAFAWSSGSAALTGVFLYLIYRRRDLLTRLKAAEVRMWAKLGASKRFSEVGQDFENSRAVRILLWGIFTLSVLVAITAVIVYLYFAAKWKRRNAQPSRSIHAHAICNPICNPPTTRNGRAFLH